MTVLLFDQGALSFLLIVNYYLSKIELFTFHFSNLQIIETKLNSLNGQFASYSLGLSARWAPAFLIDLLIET